MTTPLRALILEDSPSDAELMLHALRNAGYEPQAQRVETECDFREHLTATTEIVLADFSLPEFDALRALRFVLDRRPEIPFILVSGTIGEELAVRAMKLGVTDFILKDRMGRLGQAVSQALAGCAMKVRIRERGAELARSNDVLTAEIARRERSEADRRDLLLLLTTVQEDERRRIARELHDQMGQHLTALSLGLKAAHDETPAPSPARDRLQSLRSLTDVMGREIHDLALELRPTSLDDLGLLAALANYAEAWSVRSGVEIDYHATGLDGDRLPAPVETALYRVVQESLTNVIKHSQARRVSVVLFRSADSVSAVVEDDGRGFDRDSCFNSIMGNRLGLLGMQERANLLGGSLTVESVPGRGTAILARFPLECRVRPSNPKGACPLPPVVG
jgi:signal transduction histidine kinase